MARRKAYSFGIYRINRVDGKFFVEETIELFDDLKLANKKLGALRDAELAASGDPYKISLLPCGPKNEGLLP